MREGPGGAMVAPKSAFKQEHPLGAYPARPRPPPPARARSRLGSTRGAPGGGRRDTCPELIPNSVRNPYEFIGFLKMMVKITRKCIRCLKMMISS